MKLATFETILEISPIEGADRIELARIQGWQSVIKKGEYKVGDVVIFVPIDTVMQPKDWNTFLWDKENPSKEIRVKTVKLKGTVSQGIIFPLSIVDNCTLTTDPDSLANILSITKYEKPIPAHLGGQIVGDFPSHLVSRTDEDNLKSNIIVLEELKFADQVEATLKIDGTSATYIKELDGTFRVCSRNLELKDTESNIHWQMARKYNIKEHLRPGTCIQGEIAGPGIQGNPAGFSEVEFFIFNVIDLKSGMSLSRNNWFEPIVAKIDHVKEVPSVKIWAKEEFSNLSIDDLQSYVNTIKYPNNKPAEGLVFRGFKDGSTMYSKTLHKMLSVKIINQNFKD
jgi:RNA ligase (TIGR02306 family)